MPFTQNPLQWKNLILSVKSKVQEQTLQYLQQQLGDWCNQASLLFQQLQSAPFLAGILGGSALFPTEAANTLIGNNTGSAAKPLALTTAQVGTMFVNTIAFDPTAINNLGGFYVDSGSANAYAITASPATTAYRLGQVFFISPLNTNTGASTLAVNGLATKAIVNRANTPLVGGEILASKVFGVVYDNAAFRIITPCGLTKILANITGNQSVECAGYDSVLVDVSWNAATSTTLTLSHIAAGTSLLIRYFNGSASANNYAFAATNPAGTTITIIQASFATATTGAAAVDMTVAKTLTNALAIVFSGMVGTDRIYLAT